MTNTTFNSFQNTSNATTVPSGAIGLERYCLNDWGWFHRYYEQMGADAYWDFTTRVYKAIENLRPQCRYDLTKISEENQELFVKIACEYILEHGGIDNCGVKFSDDWTYLYRTKEFTSI
jgi:hypothetical protein